MIYITREDDISVLPLSNRLINCLRRSEIHTIGAMLDYPEDKWNDIRNMGAKSVDEVIGWSRILYNGERDYCLTDRNNLDIDRDVPKEISKDVLIEKLELTVRAINCLHNEGITMVSQLIGISHDELMNIPKMGKKTADEIYQKVKGYEEEFMKEAEQGNTLLDEQEMAIVNDIQMAFGISAGIVIREILSVKEEYPEALGETFIYLLYEKSILKNYVSNMLLTWIEANNGEISKSAIFAKCPVHLRNTTVIEELLVDLENVLAIKTGEVMIYRQYPSVMQYVNQMEDDRNKELLQHRLKGKTLAEIGEMYGVTRERIRQISMKALNRRPHLREDVYTYIFETYDFGLEEFQLSFDEPIETYNYLEMVCGTGRAEKKHIARLLEDEKVSVRLKKQAERAIYADYVTIDGVRVKRIRPELVDFVIKRYCKDKTDFDDFLEYYNILLSMLGLEENESLIIDARSYENRLHDSSIVLWNQWRSFRYYNIEERDYTDLFTTIGLEKFQDVEISTLKFFKDYPELMTEYDIRDEYELHNLLKKRYDTNGTDIKIKKMPTIEIGTVNKEKQVMDILQQYSPISAEEFGTRYEEEYGVKALTIRGSSIMRSFDKYYHNGIYKLEAKGIPDEQIQIMRNLLVNDFYTITDVQRIYTREFPDENVLNLNPYTLKAIGFHVYSGYVISNKFSNAVDYFNWILTKDDIVDAREFSQSMKSVVAYSSELYSLKLNREIIEFMPYQYVNIRRLNDAGVTTADFEDYCNKAKQFVEKGEFFTIYSLRKAGFIHPLDDLGFEDWFYSSILTEDKEHFTYRRAGGSKIFYRGKKSVQVTDLIIDIVEQQQKIDIHDLHDLLEQEYDLYFPFEKVLQLVNDTDLYYDSIMQTVYVDYDTYFEEI